MRLQEFSKIDQLINKLEKIENAKDQDFNIKVPKPITIDDDIWDDIDGYGCDGTPNNVARSLRNAMNNSPTEVEMVDHSKMITGQQLVSGVGLRQYLEKPSSELPLVYQHNGRYVIMNGHHRIVANHLIGNQSTKCEVRNLDKWIDPDGCFIIQKN